MNWNLVETFRGIYGAVGGFWAAAALATLVYAAFGPYLRVFGLSILLLVFSQSWFAPAFYLGRGLRWWVLLIVCVRGVARAARAQRPGHEPASARLAATAFGAVALASALWADKPLYTLSLAASFVITLVAAFWVLWRLMDVEDVVAAGAKGALVLGLLIYVPGFGFGLIGDATNDWLILKKTGWGSRYSGMLFNANMSGLIAMVVIPALVAAPRAWLGRIAWTRWIALAAAGAALWLSGSRSALIGTLLSLLLLFLYRFGFGAILTVALGTVGMYLIVTTSDIEDVDATAVARFTRTKHIHTLSGRVDLWREGLDAVDGRELLGLGWGSSRLLHGADPDEALEQGRVVGSSDLHSTHIQILVDLGVLGLALLWIVCLQVLLAGWRLLLQPRTDRSVAAVMVLACFCATLADSFVHGSVLSTGSPTALVFWFSAAVLLKQAGALASRTQLPAFAAAPPYPPPAAAPPAAWPEPQASR